MQSLIVLQVRILLNCFSQVYTNIIKKLVYNTKVIAKLSDNTRFLIRKKFEITDKIKKECYKIEKIILNATENISILTL